MNPCSTRCVCISRRLKPVGFHSHHLEFSLICERAMLMNLWLRREFCFIMRLQIIVQKPKKKAQQQKGNLVIICFCIWWSHRSSAPSVFLDFSKPLLPFFVFLSSAHFLLPIPSSLLLWFVKYWWRVNDISRLFQPSLPVSPGCFSHYFPHHSCVSVMPPCFIYDRLWAWFFFWHLTFLFLSSFLFPCLSSSLENMWHSSSLVHTDTDTIHRIL